LLGRLALPVEVPPEALDAPDSPPVNVDDEPASSDDGPEVPGTTETPEPASQPPSGNSQVLANLQDDIRAIWYIADRGNVVSLVNGISSAFFSVVEFTDGSATTDATFLSENGVAASRREHPERWGEARVQNGVFGFKLEGERSWLEPEVSIRTEFAGRGSTLAGCFSTSSGSIAGTTTTVSFRSLCTDADGRFAFNSTTATGGSAGGGTVSSNSRGRYLIDERAIRLDFDNGDRQDRLFGLLFRDGFVDAIVLGSSVLLAANFTIEHIARE